jgi:phosphoribosylaminoimidazolecarboxamide formyltransferase/IMP cyclohydrolase
VSSISKNDLGFKKLSGKDLSYNNYNDIFTSIEILFSEKKIPTTVITKHANPCGVASNSSPLISFKNALASDPVSAFGGIVACNYKINLKIASQMYKTFFEVIIAKGFDKNALNILTKKKNMRIIDISEMSQNDYLSTKVLGNSFLLQDKDTAILNKKKLKFVTKMKPTNKELKEIQFAFKVCKFVKSNAIVIVNGYATIGIGAGQQNRLDSCRIATQKAKEFHPNKLSNSVAASDAFFPFADGIETLINSGIKIIVQPGGSIRDKEVIAAANKAKIKMVFTGTRHFNH